MLLKNKMDYHNLKQIIRYEIKTFSREWSFKFIILFSILTVACLQVITQSSFNDPEWVAISLPSAIPYANVYLVNYLQVIIAIFWAGNFADEDRRLDSRSSILVRSFSNIEWLWGKMLGFMIVVLYLDILLAIITMLVHILLSESPFAMYPYLFYFFTLTIPTIVFITGLTVLVKGIVRQSALACILLLGLAYLAIFSARKPFHGAFDLFASSLPNAFSDLTGFSESGIYLLQRFSILLWGCALITFGILFISRLSNSPRSKASRSKVGIVLLLVGAIPSATYMSTLTRQEKERETVRMTFAKYQEMPKVNISDHDIRFRQTGNTYSASSRLMLKNTNNHAIDSVILYLNPGLGVSRIVSDNQPVGYHREQQVLVLSQPLQPGESKEIQMEYRGCISPSVCYAEITDIKSLAKTRNYYIFIMGKDYYYLRSNFTLLTPECLWYPTNVPPVNVNSPYTTIQDFTRFQLTVNRENGRIPIAQGTETQEGDNICFTNKTGIPGLSLCIGDYTRKSLMKEGIRYEIFLYKGHEGFIDENINSEEVIEEWASLYQHEKNLGYAFDKLNVVETPVHFCAYSRDWKNRSEYVQPEIVFRPEREALFPRSLDTKQFMEDEHPGEKFFGVYRKVMFHPQRNISLGNLFLNKLTKKTPTEKIKNESNVSSLIQRYHYDVVSPEFPGINLVFREMQNGITTNFDQWDNHREFLIYFKQHNLQDVFKTPDESIDPFLLVFAKGYNFIKQVFISVSEKEFEEFNQNFLKDHAFQNFSYEQYCEELKIRLGVDLLPLTRALYSEKELPCFLVKNARVQRVETSQGEVGYVQSVSVWNKGKSDGLVSLGSSGYRKDHHYVIPASSCKEIRLYLKGEQERFDLSVNTNLAQNIPARYIFEHVTPEETICDPRPGIFDTDTFPFLPNPNEHIVDNEDPGFCIVEDQRILKKLVQDGKNKKRYKNTRWLWLSFENTYGESIQSCLEKESGDGISSAEWETNLPEAGEYELFVYNNRKMNQMLNGVGRKVDGKFVEPVPPAQTYHFKYDGGAGEVVVYPLKEENGWISLGKYQFAPGSAKITLLGQGVDPRHHIIADAVKWVRKK